MFFNKLKSLIVSCAVPGLSSCCECQATSYYRLCRMTVTRCWECWSCLRLRAPRQRSDSAPSGLKTRWPRPTPLQNHGS